MLIKRLPGGITMKVVLIKDVKNLGKADDIVEVNDGYARNFLFRKQLALEATPDNLNVVKTRKKAQDAKSQKALEESKALAAKLKDEVFELPVKCGEGGRLYGAITAIDVAQALANAGYKIDKRSIQISQPIKSLGEYTLDVRLQSEVSFKLKIKVVTS